MKNQKTPAFVAVLLSLALVACGGDKSEPKPEPKPESKADVQPAQSDTKPDAPAPKQDGDTTADDAKTDATADNAGADSSADTLKAEAPSDAAATKSNVKPLSLAEGKARYEKTCKICHEQGLFDSPKLTDKANWAKRLEKGTDTLYVHSAKGFNKMPAQVTADVSEAEVYAAVDYMITQVK